ncbi:hypothetical protein NFI96_009897 [Prochilodus magdalenae]|nr:hypothetical protein NFI96_009897 [Prochilodus magdalenae]
MLRVIGHRGHHRSTESITTDLQPSCVLQISSGTVCRASWNGFPWRAAASQPYITKRSAGHGTQWCKAPPLDSRAVEACSLEGPITLLRLVIRWTSLGLAVPGEQYWSDCTVPSVEFGGGGIMVWGWCSGVRLRPLVPVRGTLNASADQETLDHSILPTLWGQFGDGPFLFQHDRTPVHRASSIKTWMSESGVEELDWPAQSPDLHPIEHLWDGLERRLRARPSRPTSVSDLTHVLLEEWSGIPMNPFLTLVERIPRRDGAVVAVKGGASDYTLWIRTGMYLRFICV